MEITIYLIVSLICIWNGYLAFKRNDYYEALLILLFLFTDGFDLLPHPKGAMSYLNTGIILMFIFLYDGWQQKKIRFQSFKLEKRFSMFAVYFLICIAFSVFHYDFAFSEVFRVIKWLFPFWSVYLFRLLDEKQFSHLMRTLLVVTIILDAIFIIQAITGVAIFTSENRGGMMGGIYRFYNKPVFSTFFLLFLLFCNHKMASFNYKAAIGIMAIALLVTFNRLEIISVLLVYCLCTFIQHGSVRKIWKMILIPVIFIPILLVFQVRDEREQSYGSVSSRNDISAIVSGDYKEYEQGSGGSGGTMTFRIAMLYERIEYMATKCNAAEIAFGLGLGHSDYQKVYRKYNFNIGTVIHLNEIGPTSVSQLASADLAWVGMLCQWGLIGLIMFCSIFYLLVKFFYRLRHYDIALVAFGYLIYLFLCSWGGSFSIEANYYLLPFATYYYLNKKQVKIKQNLVLK